MNTTKRQRALDERLGTAIPSSNASSSSSSIVERKHHRDDDSGNHHRSSHTRHRNKKRTNSEKLPLKEPISDPIKPSIPIQISGFNPNSKVPDMVNFLIRSADQPVQIFRHIIENSMVFLETNNIEHASALERLTGVLFEGYLLNIQLCPFRTDLFNKPISSSSSSTTTNTTTSTTPPSKIELLLQLLFDRYNTSTKTLDLSNLNSDSRIRQLRLHIESSDDSLRKALANLVIHERLEVHHLSLSKNRLRHLSHWGTFFKSFPLLQSLSLSENRLDELRTLETVSNHLPNLTSLDLTSNPLSFADSSKGYKKYKAMLLEWFPNLRMLDKKAIPTSLFDLSSTMDLMPIRSNLFDSNQTQHLVFAFLKAFFYYLDHDRDQLSNVYHPEALFSFITTISGGTSNPLISSYAPYNRNLKHIQNPDDRFQKLFHGPVAIIFGLKSIPKTRHVLETMVIDSWSMPNLVPMAGGGTSTIQIFIHGEFKELHIRSSETWKSFDRSILLLPSSSSSDPSQMNYQIIQDQLTIRPRVINPPWLELQTTNSTSLASFVPQTSPPSSALPTISQPQTLPTKPPEMSDHDYNLVLMAMQQYGLTWDGAILCLRQTNGDLQQIATAKSLGQIPSELFQ